jgi:superfamily I DNA/RNA helicase
MSIRPEQIAAAEVVQHAAAHDEAPCVRLVAGPGTGKSSSIEERVCWLLSQGVPADQIHAVSFTRAAAHDLRLRVHAQAQKLGYESAGDVRVSTLHSLALRLLQKARMLTAYPVRPIVMDKWEVENIFDEEFAHIHNVGKRRREEIRRWHEAFWSTGVWGPPNYIPPDPPINSEEHGNFEAFHRPRTQTYACVLPGEIIRLCVERMEAGLLDPVETLKIRHLIVDEFQDLNPNDLRFVDFIIKKGVTAFAAGDDDQSLYSFRFASPEGIQTFLAKYPAARDHKLTHCFRCAPRVLAASMALITANASPGRIVKSHVSLYGAADPPVNGTVFRWKFHHATLEARAIATSCRQLIDAGMNHRDILILPSNQRALARPLIDELAAAEVEAEHPREVGFLDSQAGRLALAITRIVCDKDDYVSHRALLALRRRVGPGTCCQVCDAVITNNLNFRAVFYDALPPGVFTGLALRAVNQARETCAAISAWETDDTLEQRAAAIGGILTNHLGDGGAWQQFVANFPPGMTLEELRDFLWADTDEQQATVLSAVMVRLGIEVPVTGPLPPRVRVMTMHGAKGLSARVVFIPGLEAEILPGPKKRPYPGLVLEAARMLYVSLTRARAACIVSYATNRQVNGAWSQQSPCPFSTNLGGGFTYRTAGLTADEAAAILADCSNL